MFHLLLQYIFVVKFYSCSNHSIFACKLCFLMGRVVDNCWPFLIPEHPWHCIRDFACNSSEKKNVDYHKRMKQLCIVFLSNWSNNKYISFTWSWEICIGFLNTVQITLSKRGGVVRDPSYLQKSRGALPSFLGNSLAGSIFSGSANETLSPLFGMIDNLSQIFLNSWCSDPT